MPSLKLSNPFRRGADRPSLRERAAALKATAGRVMRGHTAATSLEHAEPAGDDRSQPGLVLVRDILDGWSKWAALDRPGWQGSEAEEEALMASRIALIDAAEDLPATRASVPAKALALAWIEYVDLWEAGRERENYATDGRLALAIHEAAISDHAGADWRGAPVGRTTVAERAGPDWGVGQNMPGVLLAGLDLSAMPMRTLDTLHSQAGVLATICLGLAAQPCSHHPEGGINEAGAVMYRLAEDLLPWVADACEREARRRSDVAGDARRIRAQMLARPTIENDDPDETRAFALDLAALAEA